MARLRPDQPLIPSVLDRLIDLEPGATRETPRARTQLLKDLKQAVRRDLENLLNTRWRCVDAAPDLVELDPSLVNYGLPDFTAVSMSEAAAMEAFRQRVEDVIRAYEPRFKKVRVELIKAPDSIDRTLRFRIEALIDAEPAPEPVVFDSALEPVSGSFEVKGHDR
jgi:type VI secretion system protein ImpF